MIPLGTPSAPNLAVDSLIGTLNGTPWPWMAVVNDVHFFTEPVLERGPIYRNLYPDGTDSDYQFVGAFIWPFVGDNPTSQIVTTTYVDGNAAPAWSGELPISFDLYYPPYEYGPPHTLSLALNVQTAFALEFSTQTLGADGNPISVSHSNVPAHLVSGPIHAYQYSDVVRLPADVDIDLAAPFTVAPGANPFGITNLRNADDALARWIVLSFHDPDTGEAITATFDASKGPAGRPMVFDSVSQRSYQITDAVNSGEFAPESYVIEPYTYGKRTYSRYIDGKPDFTSPYTDIPDITLLVVNRIITISVTRTIYHSPLITSPPGAPSLQKIGYTPGLTAALSLPAGGGSPRLALASSRTYCDVDVQSVYDATTSIMTRTITRKYTTSAIRCSVSPDLGETFVSATDIAAQFLDGTDLVDGLTGTDTATETYNYSGTVFSTGTISDPSPWPYSFSRAVSMVAAAHGGLFVDGAAQPPVLPHGASESAVYRLRQWKAPRLTGDSFGRFGWRDAATVNADPATGSAQLNGSGTFWWTRGGYDGVRGAGGNSWGPALMVHANALTHTPATAVSADCGDTWIYSPTAASLIPATGALAHQRGASFDGAHVSLADFLGDSPSLVTGLPEGRRYLLAGADDITVRVACVDTSGDVTIYTCRSALSSPSWQTRPGPAACADSTMPVVGFTWQQRCVIALCPAPDVIAVYASADDCVTWQPTCWSPDNMVSWRVGGYDHA